MNVEHTDQHLLPRPVAGSVDELLAGGRRAGPFHTAESRSGALFDRVELDGAPRVVKYVDLDHDFLLRVMDAPRPGLLRAWELGLMDLAPDAIDHATLGAAPWGHRGVALLMRDVSAELVPAGDDPIPEAHHRRFLDHLAALAAATWGWHDEYGLVPMATRWGFFGTQALAREEALGFPEQVPEIAVTGWRRFAERVPGPLGRLVDELRRDPTALVDAVADTPWCFLHGDWKLSNVGAAAGGRTVLLDWAYPGFGPVCHELSWYTALNRARLPVGWTKESTADELAAALGRHGVSTDGWWDRQLSLCHLGALVQFGWEKALGDQDELDWWCDAAGAGADLL
ncbi:MAG: aminoglycoside phosphotransferase [Acidimicrobiia bacterium]